MSQTMLPQQLSMHVLRIVFFKDTSNNQKKGQWRRSYNNPTKMKSLQKFHGKLACHPSCRGEGCGLSTISCTILLMPAAIMLDEKNW